MLALQVAGQDAAVHAVASALRLGRLGLQRGRRPLASLVLSGPRGVGRSTLCKVCPFYCCGSPHESSACARHLSAV